MIGVFSVAVLWFTILRTHRTAMSHPSYALPSAVTLSLARDVLLGRQRSFQTDARRFVNGISSLRVIGSTPALHSAPPGWLITVNHYSRPGFRAWWIAIALASVIPAEIHWVITSAWTFRDPLRSRLFTPLTEWLLRHIAHTYNFTAMPPIPPRPREAAQRAQAVRKVLKYAHATKQPVIGLAPEGMDSPDGKLMTPPPGVGRFIAHLAGAGLTILPVGVFEDAEPGAFCIRFGPPYHLPHDLPHDPEARDAHVSILVMQAIANCLPASLRNPCAVQRSGNSST